MALRSARARGRAGFFFKLVLALVARGWFFLLVKWLCAPRGPERRAGFFFELVLALVARGRFFLLVKWLALRAGQRQSWFFSLSWFSRWWRGAGFFFRSNGLRSARARGGAGFFFELLLAPVARGMFSLLVKWLCAPRGPEVGRGVSTPPSLPLDSTLPATS